MCTDLATLQMFLHVIFSQKCFFFTGFHYFGNIIALFIVIVCAD